MIGHSRYPSLEHEVEAAELLQSFLSVSSSSSSRNPPPLVPSKRSLDNTDTETSEDNDTLCSPVCSTIRITRPPRRSRTAPVNYFAPRPGFRGFEEELDNGPPTPILSTPSPPPAAPIDGRSFLTDASNGTLSTPSTCLYTHLSNSGFRSMRKDLSSISALLRSRELGYGLHRARLRVNQAITGITTSKWHATKSWRGGSKAILNTSWSPDGVRYIAGTATECDASSIQYNKGNNLIIGDMSINKVKELPEHRVPRSSIYSSEVSGTSSPEVYMTVSSVAWATEETFFTASYDKTVKIWNSPSYQDTKCVGTLRHPDRIQVMALSSFYNRYLATGCDDPSNHFRLWTMGNSYFQAIPLETTHRHKQPTNMVPSCLAWGTTSLSKNMLIGGLSGKDSEIEGSPPKTGHLALWQIEEAGVKPLSLTPNSHNVFDAKWHPNLPIFVVGNTVVSGRSIGIGSDIRSFVRTYEPLRQKRCVQEFDCPALDINDVSFCPVNDNYVSASCTDGVTYVWDYRNPAHVLHTLKHGPPNAQFDNSLAREQSDDGVRLVLWGNDASQFYTGSSDGCLNRWNVLLAPEDVKAQTVASFDHEIACGSFSPDKTNILIGDAGGGIHILSNARSSDNDSSIVFKRAGDDTNHHPEAQEDIEMQKDGIQEANELIASGRLVRHPVFGVGKGPKYDGPWARWARPTDSTGEMATVPLKPEIQITQLYGPPVTERAELDEASMNLVGLQIEIAKHRNKMVREVIVID
ncbi:hypothetical protein FQN57_005945 [Myotisia sp. PD_48]|nr:hypothetical protein FQN57_005945 [Myotisia sp. PD_48]